MTRLSEEQKRDAALVVAAGCGRQTAADFVGCTIEQIQQAELTQPEFARELRRAEASCEIAHMRCVRQASNESRQWRSSVWWMETVRPERYGRGRSESLTRAAVNNFLSELAEAVAEEVRGDCDRERLLRRLEQMRWHTVADADAAAAQAAEGPS
ncbi:hypothetical protein [Botrimarina sp.]|uniref:hypothetical protein n=1 Tax=Botrimarina sp. TaxID=2795802 RepID=UPI0032ED7780